MNTIQPIAFDNGTISIVASDNTYDHAYADRPMNEAIVETSHHKPNPLNWKHVVSNCDERWNLIKGDACLAVLSGNWDVFESRHENRIMLVTRKNPNPLTHAKIGRLPYYYFLLLLSYSAKKKGTIT